MLPPSCLRLHPGPCPSLMRKSPAPVEGGWGQQASALQRRPDLLERGLTREATRPFNPGDRILVPSDGTAQSASDRRKQSTASVLRSNHLELYRGRCDVLSWDANRSTECGSHALSMSLKTRGLSSCQSDLSTCRDSSESAQITFTADRRM